MYKIIAVALLVSFNLASMVSCHHEIFENSSVSDFTESAENSLKSPCHDCDGHDDHQDTHMCPGLCHTPAFVSAVAPNLQSTDNQEPAFEDISRYLLKGFLNRIERPPQIC